MKINRDNYEAYLLDLMEGNLPEADKSALLAFLEANPDLKVNAGFYDVVELDTDEVTFDNKNKLYRGELNEQNIEWYLAAQAEGDTTAEENTAIEKFIQSHPAWKKQQQLFSLAKLSADDSIRFDYKSSLYKNKTVSIFQRKAFYYAAAAVIALLLITGYLISEFNKPQVITAQNEILTNENQTEVSVNIAPEDSVQPSAQPEKENIREAIKKKNPGNEKPLKPVYRIPEDRPLIAEESKAGTVEMNQTPNTSETAYYPDANSNKEQTLKLETLRKEIAGLIASNPEAFVPGALDKLIERMADGDTELTPADLQQLLAVRSTTPVTPAGTKTPLLDALAWSLNKISGRNVSLEKKFNDDGRLVAYELDAGLFKIGKEE